MAMNVDEAREMVDGAHKAGVKLVVGEPKRYNPAFRKMKQIMDDGVIGKPFMARYQNSYCELHTRKSWWVVPEISGGGEMMNELTHQANTLRWFFGEITDVACMSNHPLGPPPEDNACVTWRFENDVIATVTVSWMTRHYNLTFPAPLDHAWDERIEVFGDLGSVIVETPIGYWDVPAQLRVYTENNIPGYINGWNYIKVKSGDIYVAQLRHFADCVLGDKPSEVSGEEGLADLAAVRAAYESEATGRIVRL
jgi:predicted dehydrogenase